MWNRHRVTKEFEAGKPWLLRFFDQIRFFPVTSEELGRIREDFPHGRYRLKIEEDIFSLSDYQAFLKREEEAIGRFKEGQQQAFNQERERWETAGQMLEVSVELDTLEDEAALPEGCHGVFAPVPGSVWKIETQAGQVVAKGETLLILESMKMEIRVVSPVAGVVEMLPIQPGQEVAIGQRLAAVRDLVAAE
jgi:urea carboxylase